MNDRGPFKVLEDIGRARVDVAARVAEVNELTGREVMCAAEAMGTSADRASRCLASVRELAVAFEQVAKTVAAGAGAAALGSFQAALERVVLENETAVAEVHSASQAALSHLQFQDVAAQGLARLDERLRCLQAQAAEVLGVSYDVPPANHKELGGEKPLDNEGAGDVMLF